MFSLRKRLEDLGAIVYSFVCVRRKSIADSGKLLEYEASYAEDVNDKAFSERAALLSEILDISKPPLDPDHLIVLSKINKKLSEFEVIEKLSKWGNVYIVRYPDKHHKFLAVTVQG